MLKEPSERGTLELALGDWVPESMQISCRLNRQLSGKISIFDCSIAKVFAGMTAFSFALRHDTTPDADISVFCKLARRIGEFSPQMTTIFHSICLTLTTSEESPRRDRQPRYLAMKAGLPQAFTFPIIWHPIKQELSLDLMTGGDQKSH